MSERPITTVSVTPETDIGPAAAMDDNRDGALRGTLRRHVNTGATGGTAGV